MRNYGTRWGGVALIVLVAAVSQGTGSAAATEAVPAGFYQSNAPPAGDGPGPKRLGIHPGGGPMAPLMAMLIPWVVAAGNYAMPAVLPEIVMMTRSDFELYLCERAGPCPVSPADGGAVTAFDFESGAIYVSDSFDPHDIEQQSTLVRELVSFLRTRPVPASGCTGYHALEARRIANRWRGEQGLPALLPTLLDSRMHDQTCIAWT